MRFFTNVLRWLLGFAAFFHALIAMAATFAPDQLAMLIGIGRIAFSYVWVAQAGMLMFLIALMSIPALYKPSKYRMFVWLIAAGTLLEGIFWYRASHGRTGVVFAPFATFWLTIGVAEIVIILLLAEREVRLSFRNLIDTIDSWCESRDETNMFMRMFGYVVLAKVVLSIFPIYAHLFHQSLLRWPVGLGVLFHSEVWIALSGIELIVITALLVPVALAPTRHWSYAWLAILCSVIPTICWLVVAKQPLHRGFIYYALVNFIFAVAMFVTLQLGAPADKKLNGDNYQRFLSFVANTLALHGQPWPIRTLAVIVLALGLTVTATLWYYFIRSVPDLEYGSDEMQFKYGAVGLSMMTRVPWYLFEAMPYVFEDLIPAQGGPVEVNGKKVDPFLRFAQAVGAIKEPGQEVPIGFALREIGFRTVEPNCALCHVMNIQVPGVERPKLVYGAPNSALDIQAYQWFLYNAAVSPRFNVPTIMRQIEKKHDMGFLDHFFYRTVIIPATQGLLMELRSDYVWQYAHGRPPQGRGRTDTFNTTKQGIMLMPDDGTTGTTDLPQVWQLGRRHRKKMYMHWDGNNDSIPERNYTAAMAVGASPVSVIPSAFDRLIEFFWRLPSAPYPLPINRPMAVAGRRHFIAHCADCHSWSGDKIGQVTQSVGTDPNRAISFTTEHCEDFKKITYPPFRFPRYRKFTEPKYVNVPLDGLWVRAPYLHHGSVPTLWDLLQRAKDRPVTFYRGSGVFDPVKVGFESQGAEAAKLGTLYDTRLTGNCNAGHEYGADLTDAQKWELIEYLKTDDSLISGAAIPVPSKVDTTVSGPEQPCEEQTAKQIACNLL